MQSEANAMSGLALVHGDKSLCLLNDVLGGPLYGEEEASTKQEKTQGRHKPATRRLQRYEEVATSRPEVDGDDQLMWIDLDKMKS